MNALYERLAAFRPAWSDGKFRAVLVSLPVMAFVVPVAIVALPFNEFMNDMAAQPKAKPQMTFGRTFDPAGYGSAAARDAVPGTVARGARPYELAHLGTEPAAIDAAGAQLRNPQPYTVANMERGQKLYGIYCGVCHGARGLGDGSVIGPNRFPAPPSLHTDKARAYRDGSIFHVITMGTAIMPAYADRLPETDRWQVVQYVRALQRAENPRPEDLD